MIGSNLWLWQRAQPSVRPSQTVAVVSTRSATYSTAYSSGMMPPSALPRWLRLKPVAIFWSSVGFGQQVAGELLDREPVERQVAVVRVDHPVAPALHDARAVGLIAVGVGVPRGVEPAGRHPLAEARRAQQAVDHFLVGVRAGIVLERDRSRRGWAAAPSDRA